MQVFWIRDPVLEDLGTNRMAKKKGKSRKSSEQSMEASKDASMDKSQDASKVNREEIPDNIYNELLREPEVVEQLRLLWAETNDSSVEPSPEDFRTMLEAMASLSKVSEQDSDEELDDSSDDILNDIENLSLPEWFLDRDPDSLESFEDDEYLNLGNVIPDELLPTGYSEASELLSCYTPNLDEQRKLSLCLDTATICPQLVGAWILASSHTQDDSKRLEYLRTAIKEAEWFFEASRKHPDYQSPFEDEYVGATIDACFHLWRLGQRDEVLEIHQIIDKRIEGDLQGQLTIHCFRQYEQEHFGFARSIVKSLGSEGCCSETALNLLKSLIEFQSDPKSELAVEYLQKVAKGNSHLIEVLLGDGYWEETYSTDFEPGSQEEASWIASVGGFAIRSTAGFVRHMRNTLNYVQEPSVTPEIDFKRQIQMLATLPREPSTWILESKQLAETTYCTFVYDVNQEELLCVEADDEKPTNARLWDVLVQTMLDGQNQEPHRPSQLLLTKRSLASSWQKRCGDLEIDCEYDAEAGLPADMMEGLLDVINKVDQDVQLTDENWAKAKALPVSEEVWHVGVFQPPIWISDAATPRKSCVALVIDEGSEMIRIHDLTESRPSADYLARTIMKGMFYPLSEDMEPTLPVKIKVHPHTIPETVAIFQERLGIEIEQCEVDEDSLLDNAVEHLILHCSDASMRESLFDCCEVTESELRIFYAAIRDFYNESVWKWIPSDKIIEITFPNEEQDPFYVCVIGQSGFHFGIVCSDDLENLRAMSAFESEEEDDSEDANYNGEGDDNNDILGSSEGMDESQLSARQANHTSGGDDIDEDADEDADSMQSDVTFLNFGESHEIPPIDLWFIEQFDFDVAGEDSYPLIQRFVAEQRYRRPNKRELEQVAIAAKALPRMSQSDLSKNGVTFDLDFFYHQTTVRVRWCGNT
jgi:hypothetical protein